MNKTNWNNLKDWYIKLPPVEGPNHWRVTEEELQNLITQQRQEAVDEFLKGEGCKQYIQEKTDEAVEAVINDIPSGEMSMGWSTLGWGLQIQQLRAKHLIQEPKENNERSN